MSAIFHPADSQSARFTAGQLPSFRPRKHETRTIQIRDYLAHLVERAQQGHHKAAYLQIPSILELTVFFGCCEMDVFDALFEMKKDHYRYELLGIDAPVKLWDPLNRTAHPRKRWFILPAATP